MNVLVLIKKLNQTPLEREIRNGNAHGDVISFYNETDNDVCLIIDEVEYSKIVQACIIYKDYNYFLYIQQGENPNLNKLNIDNIEKIRCFSSV